MPRQSSNKQPSLPYPARVRGYDEINLRSLEYRNPEEVVFFEFNIDQLTQAKSITILPKDSIILTPIYVRFEEGFDGSDTELQIGIPNDSSAVGVVQASIRGAREIWAEAGSHTLFRFNEIKEILVSINEKGATDPTKGFGWGIFKYINLNRIL